MNKNLEPFEYRHRMVNRFTIINSAFPKTVKGNPSSFRMISLTANIGKLYHTLESTRTLNFMINNKYLDPSAQKAYIPLAHMQRKL